MNVRQLRRVRAAAAKYRQRRRERQERVLRQLMAHGGKWHGYELWRASRIGVGRIYVILDRWETDGVVESGWGDPVHPGGPRRCWYRLATHSHEVTT